MPPLSLQGSVSPAPGMWVCDAPCHLHFLSSSTPFCTRPSPKLALGNVCQMNKLQKALLTQSRGPARRRCEDKPKEILPSPRHHLMGFVAAMGGRSRKDKGIPEGGRRGRLHNWKFSHRSPDFKLFLKYLRIWQPRACISPWQRQLVLSGPGDWTCALHLAEDRSSGLPTSSPLRSFTSLPSWASESANPGLRDLMSRKSFRGHGDGGSCSESDRGPLPQVLTEVVRSVGLVRSTQIGSLCWVLGSGGREVPKLRSSVKARDAVRKVHQQGATLLAVPLAARSGAERDGSRSAPGATRTPAAGKQSLSPPGSRNYPVSLPFLTWEDS